MVSSPESISMRQVQKIDKRHDEHPHEVYEVPVQTGDLNVFRSAFAGFPAKADDQQGNHAAGHVQQMQASNREECGAEVSAAPGIAGQLHALIDERQPLTNM